MSLISCYAPSISLIKTRFLQKFSPKLVFFSSILKDFLLLLIFFFIAVSVLEVGGADLASFILLGLFYGLLVLRRWAFEFSFEDILSNKIVIALIPLYFLLIPYDFLGIYGLGDILVVGVFITLMRYPLKWTRLRQISLKQKVINLIFITMIQVFYGLAWMQLSADSLNRFFYLSLPHMKPEFLYIQNSLPQLKLFYEDKITADLMMQIFPEVFETLQSSSLYQPSMIFLVSQKNQPLDLFERCPDGYEYGGHYDPAHGYSHIYKQLTASSSLEELNLIKHILIHECTHQMVAQYYGRWRSFIWPMIAWKEEGYAEYLAKEFKKEQISQELTENKALREKLCCPFEGELSEHVAQDYTAAWLQTVYALDKKQLSEKDFFETTFPFAFFLEIEEFILS